MTTLRVTRAQALTWRMRRQHLLGGAADPTEVVRTLAAVSVFGSDADLAVRRRLASPGEPGQVQRALADGRLMRTFSFRGSVQVMAPETAGTYLALRSAGRQWELRSWVEHYRLTADEWPEPEGHRARGRGRRSGASAGGGRRARRQCLGSPTWRRSSPSPTTPSSSRSPGRATSRSARTCRARSSCRAPRAAPGWAGVPDLEEAGPRAVLEYVDAYGPTTPEHVDHWLGEGLSAGRKRLERWWARGAGRAWSRSTSTVRRRWHLADARRRAGRAPSRADRGAAARQGRLGDGAGHQGRPGSCPAEHRVGDDPRRQPGAGRRVSSPARGGSTATSSTSTCRRPRRWRRRPPGWASLPGARPRAQNPVRL